MNKWISVDDKDQFPKRGERVHGNSISEGVVTVTYYATQGWVEQITSKDGEITISIRHNDITHWQPLIKPPEAADE